MPARIAGTSSGSVASTLLQAGQRCASAAATAGPFAQNGQSKWFSQTHRVLSHLGQYRSPPALQQIQCRCSQCVPGLATDLARLTFVVAKGAASRVALCGEGLASRGLSFDAPELGLLVLRVWRVLNLRRA
jgi:hypothetical protein